jgi:lambda family phage tail tape measure protein
VLRRVAMSLAGMALNQGMQPLQSLASGVFSNLLGGLRGAMPFAKGGVVGGVTPFAAGGVVSSPTYFPMRGGVGLMGEAGPEAILPLQRSADGRLGVASAGGGGVNVVFNVHTQDAGSFRKSEAQITGMLARAVSRGTRAL